MDCAVSCAVYWIHQPDHTDIFTQGYVGISNNIKARWNKHKQHPKNKHLQNVINKYGWDSLVKEVIIIADTLYCLDIESKLRSIKNIGWNIAEGGAVPPVPLKKHDIKMRLKISAINKKRLEDPIYREKFTKLQLGLIPWNKGKKATQETIEKQRLSHIGKPSGKKGKPVSQESIAKLKETFKANPWTCPHCKKTGFNKGSGNRWHFNNCRDKSWQVL